MKLLIGLLLLATVFVVKSQALTVTTAEPTNIHVNSQPQAEPLVVDTNVYVQRPAAIWEVK